MIHCQYCDGEIPQGVYECPSCGAPTSHKTAQKKKPDAPQGAPIPYAKSGRGCLVACLVAVILVVLSPAMLDSQNGVNKISYFKNALQIDTEQAESYVELMREAGVVVFHALEFSSDSEDGGSVYSAQTSEGELVFHLDAEKNLVEIWSRKAGRTLYRDGEFEFKFITVVAGYRSQLEAVVKEHSSFKSVHVFSTDVWGWTDFELTYLAGTARGDSEDRPFRIVLDAEKNPLYVFIEDTEYINEMESGEVLAEDEEQQVTE